MAIRVRNATQPILEPQIEIDMLGLGFETHPQDSNVSTAVCEVRTTAIPRMHAASINSHGCKGVQTQLTEDNPQRLESILLLDYVFQAFLRYCLASGLDHNWNGSAAVWSQRVQVLIQIVVLFCFASELTMLDFSGISYQLCMRAPGELTKDI